MTSGTSEGGRAGGGKASIPWRKTLKRRLLVAALALVAWSAAIEARLVYLQVGRHADLTARAERQQLRTVETPAKRGDILDRDGRVLAYSVDADSIYAVPTDISDPDAAAAGAVRRAGRLRTARARRRWPIGSGAAARSPTCAARSRRTRRAGSPRSSSKASAS